MSRFDTLFLTALDDMKAAGLRRELAPVTPTGSGRAVRGGRTMLNFSSNDYLGLARHPALAERAAAYARDFGTGAGASRLVCGTQPAHAAVERKLAALKGKPAAMILASGWQTNASVLPALLRALSYGTTRQEILLFSDALNHNSLVHGLQRSGARANIFRHNDMDDLVARLAAHAGRPGRRFIVTESVFSMDGDRADMPALTRLAAEHDAFLYVDEAHATGVLGAGGMGLCAGVSEVDLVMGTFSKALGSFGAYVAGSEALIGYLQNACAGFVYTTALPPPVLGAIDAALDLVPAMDEARLHLAAMAGRLRTGLTAAGINTGQSTTQIVPALVGDAGAAMNIAAALRERGMLAMAIRPPTVAAGTSRLRFALSAAHTAADVDALLDAAAAVWPARRLAA